MLLVYFVLQRYISCCNISVCVFGVAVGCLSLNMQRLLQCGVVGLRWWADVSRLCVCLRWFPALVPACVCLPTTASLCNSGRSRTVGRQCNKSRLRALNTASRDLFIPSERDPENSAQHAGFLYQTGTTGSERKHHQLPLMVSCCGACLCLPAYHCVSL